LGSLEEVRRYYEAREKTIRDEANRLAGAREEGLNGMSHVSEIQDFIQISHLIKPLQNKRPAMLRIQRRNVIEARRDLLNIL
jgi:hypothetical protein